LIEERLTKVETIQEQHTKLLNAQIEKNEALVRLTTLVERQMEDSKERDRRQEIRDEKQNEQMEKFSETIVKINENLTNLNSKQEHLDQRVNGIESTLKETRKNRKQTILNSLKYIGSVVVGLGLAWLYKKIGI
jgi:hypothetical protein